MDIRTRPTRPTTHSPMQALFAAVPERVARASSGTRFAPTTEFSPHGARIAYLAQLLNWLTPFSELTPEGQRTLGILAARDKPLDRDEDEHLESEEV